MPVKQILSLKDKAIGASLWQPIHVIFDGFRCEHDTFGDVIVPLGVKAALTRRIVKQFARDAGHDDVAGVFVLKFIQAAFTTAIAQRFPLRLGHF
jgi:hypothetical protein